jgi:hypothetical protein
MSIFQLTYPNLESIFASFEKDFRDVSESIQLHSQNVDWAAQAAHIEETQRETEKARLERQGRSNFAVTGTSNILIVSST